MSVQGKFEVSIPSLHVCMNSSCVCKWFEIAKSSKLIKIFPLQIHILGLFCILSFEERKRSSSRLSFWPQKVFTVSTAFPFQGNDISTSTLQTFESNSQAELHAHRYASHNMTCFLRICSRFIGAVTSFNAGKDLSSVTYSTTYSSRENELFKTQPSSFVSCLPMSKLKAPRRTHADFQGIAEI